MRAEARGPAGGDPIRVAGMRVLEVWRHPVKSLQGERVADAHVGRDRDRIAQHARFEALDLGDFARLFFRLQVLVDDTDATLLRHGDGEPRFRNRIHGSGDERNGEFNRTGELGAKGRIAGQDGRVSRDKQHIIERECFLDKTHSNFL